MAARVNLLQLPRGLAPAPARTRLPRSSPRERQLLAVHEPSGRWPPLTSSACAGKPIRTSSRAQKAPLLSNLGFEAAAHSTKGSRNLGGMRARTQAWVVLGNGGVDAGPVRMECRRHFEDVRRHVDLRTVIWNRPDVASRDCQRDQVVVPIFTESDKVRCARLSQRQFDPFVADRAEVRVRCAPLRKSRLRQERCGLFGNRKSIQAFCRESKVPVEQLLSHVAPRSSAGQSNPGRLTFAVASWQDFTDYRTASPRRALPATPRLRSPPSARGNRH